MVMEAVLPAVAVAVGGVQPFKQLIRREMHIQVSSR